MFYENDDDLVFDDEAELFFNFDSAPDLMIAADEQYTTGRFSGFRGLFMQAIDCEQDPADILELTDWQRQRLAHLEQYANLSRFIFGARMDDLKQPRKRIKRRPR